MPPLVGVKMELRSFVNLETEERHGHTNKVARRKLSLLELASELNKMAGEVVNVMAGKIQDVPCATVSMGRS